MEWTTQIEQLFSTWTDAQKKMWDNWLEMVQQGTAQKSGADLWPKTLDTWQESVTNMLATQDKWTDTWTESFNADASPEEMTEWVEQTQSMAKQWSDAQQQMWSNWFDMMKQVDMNDAANSWQDEGQKAFDNWQTLTQKVTEAQMQWIKMWAPSTGKK